MYVKPCFATEVFKTAGTTSYGARRGWLDTAAPNVEHYGLKTYLPAPSSYYNSSVTYQIWATVHLAFKGVK